MNNKTLLLVIVFVAVVVYLSYPDMFSMDSYDKKTAESFDELKYQDTYQPNIVEGANESNFVSAPSEIMPPWAQNKNGYGETDILDDGMNGNAGLNFNMCSKSCCSAQYPPPFSMPMDPLVSNSKDTFVPSSYTCNNGWQDTGCLCMTKEQQLLLNKRGNNA